MGHDPVLTGLRRRRRQSGQAIVMVTLALIAMCGLLGLAVDFGWAYFVKRAAQGAADTAAIAAAEEMRTLEGGTGPYTCRGGGSTCRDDSSPYSCTAGLTSDAADNLDNACLYARSNGFQDAAPQRVKITEGVNSAPTTLPGVTMQYWVTVRVTETVPQLFSAITGNPMATVSARATAGLYNGKVDGSIILLNRERDVPNWGGSDGTGMDINVGGSASIVAGGGIYMASGCAGGCGSSNWAGRLSGSGSITAPFTSIRDSGDVPTADKANWVQTPISSGEDGSQFRDPTKDLPQVPVTIPSPCEVEGGVIAPSTPGGYVEIGPGAYYAVARQGASVVATGQPIRFSGDVRFRAGGSCTSASSAPTGFGTYVFYGGLQKETGKDAAVTLEPGIIAMAGAVPQGSNPSPVFDIQGNGSFSISGPGAGSAGNVFIFTDPNYPGFINKEAGTPPNLSTVIGNLKQGTTGFKSGNNGNVSFDLDGLNSSATGYPVTLNSKYNGYVMWQDRRNSFVRYSATSGNYDCDPPYLDCGKLNPQPALDGISDGSPEFDLAAGANTRIRGAIYQPRGAWAVLQGSPGMSSGLQIITGGLRVQGSGTINLQPIANAVPISILGLIE